MLWQRGFTRIRIVGVVALLAGLATLISILSSDLMGYAPNPGFAGLYGGVWAASLLLVALGLLLLATPWMLAGFLPDGQAGPPR